MCKQIGQEGPGFGLEKDGPSPLGKGPVAGRLGWNKGTAYICFSSASRQIEIEGNP